MGDRKGKRTFISLSSDSEEDEEEEEEEEEEEDGDEEEPSSSSSLSDDDDSEWSAEDEEDQEEEDDTKSVAEEDDDDDDDDSGPKKSPVDDQALYNRVIHLLKGGDDLQSLKLEECKAYLRKHDLRLTGTKAVCIQRIQEHWRIKDGGEKLYPRSSFTINCTGDVCKGDVVVFKQRVYERFDKVTRTGNILGKRTVAGRVVKESYGAAKQQHTFTVEVLWSKGVKKLAPLFPLLVKGRNLYRMKTFRQRWANEAERAKVLAEKHKRGTAARHLRATKKASTANGAVKCQKHSHHTGPPQKRHKNQESQAATKEERKHCSGRGKVPPSGQGKKKRVTKARATTSSVGDLRPSHLREKGVPVHNPYSLNDPGKCYGQQMLLHSRQVSPMIHANREAFNLSNHGIDSTSTVMRMPLLRPYSTVMTNPRHYAYTNPGNHFDPSSLNRFPNQAINDSRINSVPSGTGLYRVQQDTGGYLLCSTPGCRDQRDDKCIGFSCWRCCRRTGRRCHRHQLYTPF